MIEFRTYSFGGVSGSGVWSFGDAMGPQAQAVPSKTVIMSSIVHIFIVFA